MPIVNNLAERLSRATPSQQSLHNNFIVSMNTARRGLVRGAFYLARISENKVYRILGYSTVQAYAHDAAGLSPHQTKELIYMGRKLSQLPEIATAVDSGALSWHKARMIIAKASPKTELELINIARNQTNQELKNALGTTPMTPKPVPASAEIEPSPDPGPVVNETSPGDTQVADMTTDVVPLSPATSDEHVGSDRSQRDSKPTSDPSPPPKKLHITVSFTPEEYARWEAALASERSHGNKLTLGPLFLEALERSQTQPAGHATPTDGPGTLLVILECPTCGRATINTSRGEQPAPRALIEVSHCDALVETERDGRIVRRHVVPQGLRRAVMRRDRMTCQAEGCHNNRNLEIHHRIPASQGGKTELDNLITLCRSCHRALHAQDDAAARALKAAENLP